MFAHLEMSVTSQDIVAKNQLHEETGSCGTWTTSSTTTWSDSDTTDGTDSADTADTTLSGWTTTSQDDHVWGRDPTSVTEPNPSDVCYQHPSESEVHFKERYVEIKYLGEGDNGVACAAISKADLSRTIAKHRGKTSQAYLEELRSKLVVVKYAKEENLEGDLTDEIQFLNNDLTGPHPNITHAVDSHFDGGCQWLALPYCNGGNMLELMRHDPQAFDLSFRWHIGAELAEALLFLHFGVKDIESTTNPIPQSEHRALVHRDIFPGNILLRSSGNGHPDIILADFGRACKLTADDCNFPTYDIYRTAYVLQSLRPHGIWDENTALEAKHRHREPGCGHENPFESSYPECQHCQDYQRAYEWDRDDAEAVFDAAVEN